MKIKFYDTSSLLLKADSLFENNEKFAISSITLEELEKIKTSNNKDSDIKYSARRLVELLDNHIEEYDIILYSESMNYYLDGNNLDIFINNDAKILACALSYKAQYKRDEIIFVTNDICLKHLARLVFDKVESVYEDENDYTGFKDITMSNKDMEKFYSNYNNIYNLNINEYLIVRNE